MSSKRLKAILGTALVILILLGHSPLSRADMVTISIITPVTGSPGTDITVFGNLTNNTSSTQYFGNDAINLTAPSTVASASDDIILNGLLGTGPTSIAAGATLTGVDLFTVQLLGGFGTFTGNTFQLIGGTDAVGCANGASDCNTLLGTANFSVNVPSAVPLPAAVWLLISGLGWLGVFARKRVAS
jgi:hypothetical protein